MLKYCLWNTIILCEIYISTNVFLTFFATIGVIICTFCFSITTVPIFHTIRMMTYTFPVMSWGYLFNEGTYFMLSIGKTNIGGRHIEMENGLKLLLVILLNLGSKKIVRKKIVQISLSSCQLSHVQSAQMSCNINTK